MTNSHIMKNTTITVTEMKNCTDMAVPIFHRGSAIGVCNSENFILTLCTRFTVLIGLEMWKYWTIVKV